jgi:iron complex outermembrane recepter protein
MIRRNPQSATLALAVALALAGAHLEAADGALAAVPRAISIPAQPLDQALNAWARQTGAQVVVQQDLVAGRLSPAVSGSFTPRQALDRLLAGSGLTASIDGGAAVVQRAGSMATASDTLPEVLVTAGADAGGPTARERGYRAEQSAATGFREQPILDTPFSVAAIPAEVIADQQARTLVDVVKNDPSVSRSSSPLWYDRINLRGFYLGVDAVFRDGLGINDQGNIALENKAAVELSKGLSALRYGATSPGGTINYVVKRPPDEPLARLRLYGDGHGTYGTHADLGGRFGDENQFGVRVNAAWEEPDTYVDDYQAERRFFSTFADWQVTPDLRVELDFEYQDQEKSALDIPSLWAWDSLEEARAAFDSLEPDTVGRQPWAVEPNIQTYLAGHLHYRLNEDWRLRLSALSARLKRDQNSVNVVSAQPNGDYDMYLYYSPGQERNNTAFQAVVEGDVTTGPVYHALAFGYDGIRRDMTYPDGFYDVIGTGNLFTNPRVPNPNASSDPAYLANRSEQTSFFLTDTLSIGEQVQLFAGVRHTDLRAYGRGSAADPLTTRYDQSAVNPSFGLVYKPVPALSLYASYAEGIERGGTAPVGTTNQDEMMDPVESTQYEAGVKYELGEGALLTAALFRIDKGLEYINAGNTYVQDGRQIHEGAELTLSGHVTRDLRLIAGAAWLDALVDKTSDTSLVGKRPQGVPEWQANLFADYDLSRWVPGLAANGGLYYGGEKPIDIDNIWQADSWVRLDLGVRYEHRIGSGRLATWRVSLENVTDERYLANTTWGYLEFGAPRTLLASVEIAF